MTIRETKHRPAGAAIAAALLLSTSPLAAQVVEPAPAGEPTVTSEPVATTSEPVVEPTTTTPTETTASDAGTAPAATTSRARTTARQSTSARASAPRTASARPATPAPAAAEPAAPVAAAPVPTVDEATIEPMAPVAAEPAPVADPVASAVNDDMMIAGAAGAGLLALAGLGFAVYRRRRREEEDYLFNEEPALIHEPAPAPTPPVAEEPVPVAAKPAPMPDRVRTPMQSASAFAWGNAVTPKAEPKRRESMTEAAMRGPTPDNPSLSLKKRLKRAAFFEQRERQVRAGKALPVESLAGLPDAVTETTQPSSWTPPSRVRELQHA